MDCPSEESLIRMKLEGLSSIKSLVFLIEKRKLTVFHSDDSSEIEKRLKELNLGSERKETTIVKQEEIIDNPLVQSKLLWTVLIINFAFLCMKNFTIENKKCKYRNNKKCYFINSFHAIEKRIRN